MFALALFATLAAASWWRSRRDAALAAVAGAAAVLAGALPWRLWVAAHDVATQGSFGRVTDGAFLAHHVARFRTRPRRRVAHRRPDAVAPRRPLAVLAVAWAWRAGRQREAAFAAGVVLLSLAGLVLAYWTTPLDPVPPRDIRPPRGDRARAPRGGVDAASALWPPRRPRRRRRPRRGARRRLRSGSVTAVLFTCAGQRVDIVTAFAPRRRDDGRGRRERARARALPRRPARARPAGRRPRLHRRAARARRAARRPARRAR